MSDTSLLRIFVKNQLAINPSYDGESLVYRGERIDLTDIANELKPLVKLKVGDGSLEILISYLITSDYIRFKVNNGSISLRTLLAPYRKSLPTKKDAENFIERMVPSLYELVKPFVAAEKGLEKGVYSSNLVLNNFSKDLLKLALSNILGLEDTRPIYTRTKSIVNGNILDILDSDFTKLARTKQPFTGISNMVRSFGFPYSDYRQFISYGILVSVDQEGRLFVVRDDTMYCCNDSQLHEYLEHPDNFNKWSEQFSHVYVIDELNYNRSLRLELIR